MIYLSNLPYLRNISLLYIHLHSYRKVTTGQANDLFQQGNRLFHLLPE